MKRPKIWVLVADAGRARILRDVLGTSQAGDEHDELLFRSEQRHLRDIMSDKPGRSFSSTGTRRSAMEYHSDPVREDDRAFAATLAEVLESHRLARDFDHLVVAAAPQTLGDLRQAFSESLRKVTIAEIAKDFTKLAAPELRKTVANLEFTRLSMGEG
jgi:protein required for attachment to host cells